MRRIRSLLAIALLGAIGIQCLASVIAPKAANARVSARYVEPAVLFPTPGRSEAHRPTRYVPGYMRAVEKKDPRSC